VKRLLSSAAALVALDQASKGLVFRFLEIGHIEPIFGDTVRLRHVHNAGAAFSLFQGSRLIFIVISTVSIALILYLTITKRYVFRGSRIAFGMILGGALGNLVDRLWLTRVIDFIDVGFGNTRWPVFNIADIGVTLGVLYLAVRFLWPPAAAQGAAGETAGSVLSPPPERPDHAVALEGGGAQEEGGAHEEGPARPRESGG